MKIELLYFDGCPSHEAFLPHLQALLTRRGLDDKIEQRRIETAEAAESERFLGSPTLRIDGTDIDPGATARSDYGYKCRLYRSRGEATPVPPDEWVLAALDDAQNSDSKET